MLEQRVDPFVVAIAQHLSARSRSACCQHEHGGGGGGYKAVSMSKYGLQGSPCGVVVAVVVMAVEAVEAVVAVAVMVLVVTEVTVTVVVVVVVVVVVAPAWQSCRPPPAP